MLKINKENYIPLDDWELSWRISQNNLELNDLNSIFPLNIDTSKSIWKFTEKLYGSHGANHNYSKTDWVNASQSSDEDIEKCKIWLKQLPIEENKKIILQWDRKNSVATIWKIFLNYWDFFCYPSFDDVGIFPNDFSWILIYSHYEIMNFAEKF